MFPPVFPLFVPELAPYSAYAPLIWLGGMVCLWLTRYTHQLGKRWGPAYYAFSALIRPLGILLIAVGWLAVYSPNTGFTTGWRMGWLPRGDALDVLCWVAIGLFFALGIWAVVTLGLRRSFLFRRVGEGLVTRGPYALVRHPQFLSAIGMTLFSTVLFRPLPSPIYGPLDFSPILTANWLLFTLAFWVLAVLEDRELAAHFGPKYEEYARRVPRLLPN